MKDGDPYETEELDRLRSEQRHLLVSLRRVVGRFDCERDLPRLADAAAELVVRREVERRADTDGTKDLHRLVGAQRLRDLVTRYYSRVWEAEAMVAEAEEAARTARLQYKPPDRTYTETIGALLLLAESLTTDDWTDPGPIRPTT